MGRTAAVLDGGINPDGTRQLLLGEWQRLGGTGELLEIFCDIYRRGRVLVSDAQARGLADLALPIRAIVWKRTSPATKLKRAEKLCGVANAIHQIDHFIAEDRPLIVEALGLTERRKKVAALWRQHRTDHPEDRETLGAFWSLQEALAERAIARLAPSPSAVHAWLSRPGPPVAHLARLVIAPLWSSGYRWPEIAVLVDDGSVVRGRADRLRNLHESDIVEPIRKSLMQVRATLAKLEAEEDLGG